jgi:transposase-like protein
VRSRRDLLRSPQWSALRALLDDLCHEQGLRTRSGTPNYGQLARACGLHPGLLLTWRRQTQRPSRASLETLAQWAGQEVGPWLRAGGYEEAPPPR